MTPPRAEEKFRFYSSVSREHRAICKATCCLNKTLLKNLQILQWKRLSFIIKLCYKSPNSVTDTTCYERFVLNLYWFVVDAVKLHSINLQNCLMLW